MDKETALQIIAKTKDDYNRMAAEFARTRGGLPQDLLDLKRYIVKGEKVLDLGCGNGRFSELFDADDYVGVDVSEELMRLAKEKYPNREFVSINATNLPFPDNSFDKVFCLAVIHHIPSKQMRQAFLAEAKRVLKPGGLLILTAWYLLDKLKTWRELAKMALLKIAGRNKMDLGDILVPFKDSKGTVLAERYVHTFSVAGLRRLVGSSELRVESSGLVSRGRNRNVEVVGRK